MKISILASSLVLLVYTLGCSGTMKHDVVSDDRKANGIRYFPYGMYELQVFYVKRETRNSAEHIQYIPVGDRQIVDIPDPHRLLEANYEGVPFGSVNFQVKLNKNGTLKQVELKNQANAAAEALNAANTALSTPEDAKKAKMQKELDDLNLQIELIKARRDLEELKKK
jgi:hypothetical protein